MNHQLYRQGKIVAYTKYQNEETCGCLGSIHRNGTGLAGSTAALTVLWLWEALQGRSSRVTDLSQKRTEQTW